MRAHDVALFPLTLLRQKEPDAYRVDKGDVLTVFAEDVLGVRDRIPVQVNPDPQAAKPATLIPNFTAFLARMMLSFASQVSFKKLIIMFLDAL